MKEYKVAEGRTAWHSKEEKYYYEGEVIPLSHLNDSEIARLIQIGLIVETKTEVKHGKSNINEAVTVGKLPSTATDGK